jgi:signal peptidase I
MAEEEKTGSTEETPPPAENKPEPEPVTPETSPEEEAAPAEAPGEPTGEEPGKKPRKEKRKSQNITFWQGFREVVVILLIAALVAIVVQSFFVKAFIIPSSSMSSTLQVGDRVMVNRVTYYFRKPRRGDVVVWRYPPDDPKSKNTSNPFYWPFQQIGETLHLTHRGTTPFVKRVIATEGETFQLKKGKLYINGKRINEPYIVSDTSDFGPVKVPKGMFYGLGDNRPNSRDSRFFGPIPYRNVIGRVFLIWWPPSRFGKPRA